MVKTFETPQGPVTINFKRDGYIVDATDWDAIRDASAMSTTTITYRATYDGKGTYGLEYYYTSH